MDTYESIKKGYQQKQAAESVKSVDADYVNRFLTDAKNFVNAQNAALSGANWASSTDAAANTARRDTLFDLTTRADMVVKYLDVNKSNMKEEDYKTFRSAVDTYKNNFNYIDYAGKENEKYYSQFATQQDYDKYLDDRKAAEEKRKLLEQLDQVNAEYDPKWYAWNNAVNNGGIVGASQSQNERAIAEFENLQQTRKDILSKVTEKDRYDWEGLKMSQNAAKDKNFQSYAAKGAAAENPKIADVLSGTINAGWLGSSAKPVNKVTYTRDNWDAYQKFSVENASKNPVYANLDASAYGLYDLAMYMTEDEVNTYNYYLGKDLENGTNQADQYLKYLEEELNGRKGTAIGQKLSVSPMYQLGYAAVAGLDQFGQGIKNLGAMFSWDEKGNYVPTSSAQVTGAIAREGLKDVSIPYYNWKTGQQENIMLGENSIGQAAYDAIQSGVNMLPSIVVSTAVGVLNPAAGAAVGGALLGASAAGNAYQEKIQAGWTQSEARSYGLMVGASEAALETVLGAVGSAAGGGLKGLLGKVNFKGAEKIGKVIEKAAKTAGGKIALDALGEGVEEGIQSVLESAFATVAHGDEFTPDMEEALYSALLGAFMGAGFGAANPNTYQGNIQKTPANDGTVPKAEMPEVTAPSVNATVPTGIATPTVTATTSQTDALANVEDLLRAAKPDPVADATKAFKESGVVSNSKAEAILSSPEAVQQLTEQTGIPIEGDTAQQMESVKQAIAALPQQKDNAVTMESVENQTELIAPTNTNAISKPLNSYPAEKQNTIRAYLQSVDEKIKRFVQKVKGGDLRFERHKISDVSERAASDIGNLLNIDVSGYTHNINTSGVQHTLIRHGENGKADQSMAIDDDLARIGWVLENYDTVELLTEDGKQVYSSSFLGKDGNPAPQIRFIKKIDGTYYVVEAAFENDYKKIWVQSAYLQKNEDVTQTSAESQSANHGANAQSAFASPSSDNNIYKTSPAVNPQFSNESVGAAPAGFDQYSNLQYQYGNKPDRANTVRDINVPNRDSQGRRVSDYAANLYGNTITSDQMIPGLEKRIAAGEFGADVKHLADTKENSFNHINDVGIEKSADEVKNAVSKGEYSDDLLAQAQILYANYQAKGDMVKAGDMAVYAAEIARAGGRILNVAKMTRMLTPDGQLEARLRLAELADQRIKKKKKNAKAVSVSKDTHQKFKNVSTAGETVITDAANELSDAAKVDYAAAAKSAIEKASAKNSEIADRIFKAELTPEQKGILYGDRIAKANETKVEAEEVTEDEVYNAIMAFVDSKKKKTASPKTKKAALDALAQYYGNKAEFQEVWSAARRRAEANLSGDVKATEALQQFFDTGAMAQDVMDAQDANSVSGKAIRQAAKGAGVDLQSLIAKSAEDKAAALAEIQKYVQSTYNLDKASALEMATQLQESFFEELSRRQTKRLLSMFGQKDAEPKTQQSVMDKFRELYNLGAFTKDAFISREALKKLFGADGITLSDEVLQQYGEISDARKAEMDQRILQEIADQIPSSFAEVYRKWRYTSMLANPSTHIKNMSGNFGMFLIQYGLKDSVAAGIETVGSVVSGGKMKRTKSFLNPLSKKDGQLVSNAWNDYGTIMNNNGEVAQRIKNGGKYYSPQSEIQKLKKTFAPLDAVSNVNTAAMDAEDAIFGRTAYSLSLAGYMKANKLTEITEEARAYAISQAQEATFHDDSLIYQKVRKLIKDGNVVVPFVKTPSNVTSRAIEYSPGMLIKSGWDIVQAARGKEGYTAAKAINNASKGIVGSALYGVGAWLAAQGILRVVGAGDDETREYEKMMGYKDFSICIGGTYISADFLTPSIIPLLTGASIWESAQNLSDGNISFTDALNAIYSVTDPIISSSMLSSLDGMMYAIRSMDEAQSGELVGTILLELGKSYISQSIPSLVRRIASASDNTAREIYQNSENPLDYYWQNIMGSIPGTTQNLKTKYDVWGQPFKRNDVENDAGGWIFSAITPSNIYDVHETPIDEEILRLQKAGFDALPSANPKTITIDGEKVRLTQDQYETYERVEGQTAYAFAEQIMDSESYKAMTDEQKSEVLNAAYKVANELGKIAALGDSYTPDNSGINKYYAMAEENGIDPQVFFTDVYEKYKIIGDSDEKPSRKAQQFASYLEKLEADGVITQEQKAVIKNTMKFYNMSPADTVVYDRFVESGVESENADYIIELFGGLTPEEGYTSVRPVQKYEAIAGAKGFTEEEKIAAMKAQITDEKLEAKFDKAIDRGYDTEDFADAYRANSDSKKKADFIKSMKDMGYTAAQAMWFYNLYHGK